jgi:hypothetical protein
MTSRLLNAAALVAVIASCGPADQSRPRPAPNQDSPHPTPAQRGPQWPAAVNINQTVLRAMSAAASNQVRDSPVPVLVPTDRELLAASGVTVDANHYTFASSANGLTVSIQANSRPKESPASVAPAPSAAAQFKAGDRQVSITENEAIRVATWFENGIAYSADVECASTTDPRCRDNQYLLSLVRDLAFVGGRPR